MTVDGMLVGGRHRMQVTAILSRTECLLTATAAPQSGNKSGFLLEPVEPAKMGKTALNDGLTGF